MGSDVHFQRSHRGVGFLAVLAAEGFLRSVAGGAVELAVFGQAGVGGVDFSTVGALVSGWLFVFLGWR